MIRRLGLLVVAATVPLTAACGAPDGVPQWKDAVPADAAPSPTGTAPALPDPAATGTASSTATVSAGAAAAGPGAGPGADGPGADGGGAGASYAGAAEPGGAASSDRFVAAVRDRLPELALDRRPEEITEMGGEACAGLAAARPRAAVAENLQRYGVVAPDARELVVLARSHLCRS